MPLTLATTAPGEPEIFASLQGEGASSGELCTFVRLSGCNLACTWCDTPYTWRFSGPDAFDRRTNRIRLEEDDVAGRIAAFAGDRLVITGGEPLAQGAALARMLELLPPHRVEIETNGTIPAIPALDPLVAQYNVSPKLRNSGNHAAVAQIPSAIEWFARNAKSWFKFVIVTADDLTEVLGFQARHAIPGERIFLMPEGTNSEALTERAVWLQPLARRHGMRFTDRLHIHLYGDTRGT